MLIAKIIGTAWMLVWFFILFKSGVRLINRTTDPVETFFAVVLAWMIIGMGPIAIIKFGWSYIG